jgi:glycosyltransferase domain-containing protein
MTNIRNLSIVIPTYNRPHFIMRSITFWSSIGVKLYILDGSKDFNPLCKNLPENVYYFHKPIPFLDRLRFVYPMIETEYSTLMPDDEFFLPSTIKKCISVIENNDIVSCGGQCIRFEKNRTNISYSLIYTKLRSYNFLQDNGITRMQAHMLDYTPSTLYSVMKTETWKKCMTLMTKRIVDVYSMLEIEFEMAATFHGKCMTLPDVLWLRSNENKPIRNEPGLYTNKLFSKWWPDQSKKIEHDIVINDVIENFKDSNINHNQLREGIKITFDNIVTFQNKFEGKLSHKLALKFPKFINSLNIVRNYLFPKTKSYSLEEILHFSDDELVFPIEDIKQIDRIIHNFHFKA